MAEDFTVVRAEDFTVPPVQAQPLNSWLRKGDVGLSARMMDEALAGVEAPGTYDDVVAELNSVPESPRAESLLQNVLNIREQEKQALGEHVLALEAVPPETKKVMLEQLGQKQQIENYLDSMAYVTAVPEPGDNPLQARIFENIDNALAAKGEIENARIELAKSLDTDNLQSVTDFVLSAIPFTAGSSYHRLLEKVRPALASKLDYFLPGEALRVIKDELLALKSTDPVAFEQFAKELYLGIDEFGGHLGDNDFQKYTMMQEVFSEVQFGINDDSVDWDRWINNAIGLLDTIGVGQIMSRFLRFGKAALSTRADTLARTNPKKTGKLIDEALRSNNDAAAQALGFKDRGELASSVLLPLPPGVDPSNMPGSSLKNWLKAEKEFQELAGDTNTFIHFTEAEKSSVVSRAVKSLEEFQGAEYYPSWSNIERLDDGVRIDAVYGQTGDFGYLSAKQAKEAADRLFPGQGAIIRKRKLATGKLWKNEVVSFPDTKPRATVGPNGEIIPSDEFDYFIQVRKDYGFNKDTIDTERLVFGPDAISKGAAVPASRFLLDPDSLFGRFIAKGANVAFDKSKGIEARLLQLMKPFRLVKGAKSKLKVLDTVAEGEGVKTFTPYELEAKGFTVAEQEGYYAIRSVMDGLYALNNAKLSRELTAKGMQAIKHTDFQVYAKPLAVEDTAGITHAFDLEQRAIVQIGDVDKLYAQGFNLGKMHSSIRIGKEGSTYVLFRKGGDTTVGGLPPNVLKYVPGYVTRFYENTHFVVVRENAVVDGTAVQTERAVHAANSRKEAERAIAVMKERGEVPAGATIDWRLERSLQPDQIKQYDFDLHQQRGGVFFGRRGDKITDLEGTAKIQDPLAALTRAVGKMSHNLGHEDWVQTMKTRFVNTYKDLLPATDGTARYPTDFRLLDASKGNTTRLREAKTAWQYINDMENVQSETAEWWMSALNSIADFVENTAGNTRVGGATAAYLRGHRRDPMQFIRGLTFDAFLTLSPLRQVILQSQQASYLYAIDPAYVGTRMVPELAALKIGSTTIGLESWPTVRARMSKLMGMHEDEYESFIKGWVNSGMDAAIDSHALSRESFSHLAESLNRNTWTRYAHTASYGVRQPLNAMRAIGFDLGERLNLQQTWLIARNQFIKNNPKKDWRSKQALQEIAGQARSMSLSMTKAGSFAYQRGFLAMTTQFASIMHKAMFGVMTNKTFTRNQKARIVAGQALLYGGAGFVGLDAALDFAVNELGIDVTPEQNQLLQAGLAEWIVNTTIRAATDDDTNITVSKHLAPAGGVERYVGDMAEAALSKPAWEFAAGPSSALGNRVMKAAQIVEYMYQRSDQSTPQALRGGLKAILAVGSGYSNILKFQVMKNLGHAVTGGGDPVLETTYAEAVAKMFGVNPRELEAYYQTMEEITAYDKKTRIGFARDDARRYYDAMKRVTSYYVNDMPNSLDDLFYKRLEEAMKTEAMILTYADPDYRDAVLQSFYEMLGEGVDIRKDVLWDNITKLALGNQMGDELSNVLTQMEYRGLIATEQDRKNIETLWNWFTVTKGHRNANTD